jgi:hypothetical protein
MTKRRRHVETVVVAHVVAVVVAHVVTHVVARVFATDTVVGMEFETRCVLEFDGGRRGAL